MPVQKELVAGLYDRASSIYDQVGPKTMSRFGARLVELMDIQAGARVLDVGVGRGANLFPAAEQVGPSGRVVGIDISQGMLDKVRDEVEERGLKQVELVQMDGEQLDFADASFDHLLSGYTIFWFGDLQSALHGFYRVLKEGGTVGISMYGGGDPRWTWFGELLREYGEKHVKFTSFGGNSVNGKPDVLEAALEEAGFESTQIVLESFEIVFTNANEWWEEKWTHGSRAPLEQMPPDIRSRFKAEALAKLAEMEEDGVYRMEWKTCFAIAQKLR